MKGISDLLDSGMDDSLGFVDENSILSTSSEVPGRTTTSKSKRPQPKKSRKRKSITMVKPKSRVGKASPAAKKAPVKQTIAKKRKALKELVNEQASEEDDGHSEEEIEETQSKKPRSGIAALPKNTRVTAKQDEMLEGDEESATARSNNAGRATTPQVTSKKALVQNKPAKASRPSIRETQQDLNQANSDTDDAMDLVEQPKARNVSRQNSRMRQETSFRRRAGSASDIERGDPNLRRKLGDVTRRFENIELKYRNLKEVGIAEANTNVDRMRKQCDATTQASNELIASLKNELAMQSHSVQDARKLKKQIQSHEAEASELRRNNANLSAALTAAQNEIKSLQAKLAAARSACVATETSRTPARDAKAAATSRSMALTPATEAVQNAQMKEELYSDLTGLIVRGVKRGEDGDTYDCIQTGRNGSKWPFPMGFVIRY
jgi:Chromosome segregation protein Csm1/Pcs1